MTIISNYEHRTGKQISPEQLHDGSLGKLLSKEDYNVGGKVSNKPIPTLNVPKFTSNSNFGV